MTQHFELPKDESEYEIASNRYATLDRVSDISNPRIRIAVQDSTKNQKALQSALDMLREAGYRQVYASRNWQDPLPTTRVIAQSGDDEAATEVQSILGVGRVVVESTGAIKSDVTVQLGRDWKKHLRKMIEAGFDEDRQL